MNQSEKARARESILETLLAHCQFDLLFKPCMSNRFLQCMLLLWT